MDENIPGTEYLVDQNQDTEIGHRIHNLQHRQHGDSTIILVPQPSLDDPNDPLRWSPFWKWATFLNACFFAFNGSVLGPIIATGYLGLSVQFDKPLSAIAQFSGGILITQGMGNIFWGPTAVKFGRRPVYLLSNLGMTLTCVWCAIAAQKSYTDLLVARIFQGLVQAPVEAIVPSTIGDIFFLHERGKMVGLYGLAVVGGNAIGPLISSFLVQGKGVPWSFWMMTILCGANWIFMVFFMPETKYLGKRPALIANRSHEDVSGKLSDHEDEVIQEEPHTDIPEKSLFAKMAVFPQVERQLNWFKLFCRPFVLLTFPTVLWSSFIYGMALAWGVIFSVAIGQMFGEAPYNFSPQQVGLVYISACIGCVIGWALSGPLSDTIALYFTRRNGGLREPEHRLPSVIPAALFTVAGGIIFGTTAGKAWIAPVIGFGVLSVGFQMAANFSMSYSVDSHKALSAELMVTIAGLKSAIAYIFTWVVNDWIISSGIQNVFITLSFVNLGLFLATIPMWFYGKRVRIWIYRTQLFKKLHLD